MLDDNTKQIINEILAQMQAIWKKSHRWITRDEFEKLKQIYNSAPNKKMADSLWSRNGLPTDFVFQEHKFPMTKDVLAYLNNSANLVDYHFSLSAQDIIDKQVAPWVAACSGHAKLFSYLAAKRGLDTRIIMTADLQGYSQNKEKHLIDGHQIIAVRGTDGKLVAFDPKHETFQPLKDETEIKVGNMLQSVESKKEPHPKYKITAILTPDEFAQVRSYNAPENLYLYGSGKSGKFHKGIANVHRSRADAHKIVEQMMLSEYQNE